MKAMQPPNAAFYFLHQLRSGDDVCRFAAVSVVRVLVVLACRRCRAPLLSRIPRIFNVGAVGTPEGQRGGMRASIFRRV